MSWRIYCQLIIYTNSINLDITFSIVISKEMMPYVDVVCSWMLARLVAIFNALSLSHRIEPLWIFKSGLLSNKYQFTNFSIQECTLDMHLIQFDIMAAGKTKQYSWPQALQLVQKFLQNQYRQLAYNLLLPILLCFWSQRHLRSTCFWAPILF